MCSHCKKKKWNIQSEKIFFIFSYCVCSPCQQYRGLNGFNMYFFKNQLDKTKQNTVLHTTYCMDIWAVGTWPLIPRRSRFVWCVCVCECERFPSFFVLFFVFSSWSSSFSLGVIIFLFHKKSHPLFFALPNVWIDKKQGYHSSRSE